MMDQKSTKPRTLVALVGAACAGICCVTVANFEGLSLIGYRDPVGIPTKCYGDTTDVKLDYKYTTDECRASLETQLISHAADVLRCTPVLTGHTYQLAAEVSFAYNIGTGAYCASTTAKRFTAGDWAGACRAMNESDTGKPQWITAKGVVLPGLVKRRAAERALCETDLPSQ